MRALRTSAGLGFALAAGLAAAPAFAHELIAHPGWHDGAPAYGYDHTPPVQQGFMVDRALAERCGLRAGSVRPHLTPAGWRGPYHRDDGLGGALIGGAVGGVLGNRIAGPGDRTVGTIAGAAVGAAAGAAIDRAEDRHRPGHDWSEPGWEGEAAIPAECDAVLPPGYALVAVPGGRECHDEVVTHEDWVPETVTIPGRAPPRRAPPLRDKRIKLRKVQ